MSWDTGKWSEPIRITEAIEVEWWKQIRSESMGVYRLIALRKVDSLVPAELPRVCQVDETGTLSIGATESLMNRLGSLVKTQRVDYRSKPHRALCERLAKDYPPEKLAFLWEVSKYPWVREQELHDRYEAEFGELPPMDRSS
jgi:hypothetical protein